MAEEQLMNHLFETFRQNKQEKYKRKLTRKHGNLEEWKEFAECMAKKT